MPRGKPLDNAPWDKMQLDYMTGQATCKDLSIKYSISLSAISKRCTREGWQVQRTQVVQKVSNRTIEKVVDSKLERINAHHSLVVPIAEQLVMGVKHSYESMHGEPIDSAHLNGLAQALSKANQVALLNLGFVPATQVDVTSGGLSMHQSMLAMIEASRKMASEGKLLQSDVDAIDVKGLLTELEESKKDEK